MTTKAMLYQIIEALPDDQLEQAAVALATLPPAAGTATLEAVARLQVTGTSSLYATDVSAWAQAQAQALRAKDWAALDLHNLIEEVEDLAGRHRDAIEHQLERLLIHLLKYRYQPEERPRRGRGWQVSIASARHEIRKVIRRHPSLQAYPAACLAEAYAYARRQAALQTGLPLATFPEACPWPLVQVLDEDWWPEGQP